MHILILNWKDIHHKESGGAEHVTHEYAKQLVRLGHQVIIFCSSHSTLTSEEFIDGIKIIRRGSPYTVHIHAFFFYHFYLKNWPDIVIDQIHGIPFFSPLYVQKPILAWIHEVAGSIWLKEFPLPLAGIGFIVESLFFKIYTKTTFITHTPSTKKELVEKGVPVKLINVLPHTLEQIKKAGRPKFKNPTLIYIGRITPMKRIELLLQAVFLLRKDYPYLKAIIVGSGKPEYIGKLKILVHNLQIYDQVEFKNHVTERRKYRLLTSSWIHVHPSVKEGFGLTVLEAAMSGTPTICFDVGGLKDVVLHKITGIVVARQSAEDLMAAIAKLLSSSKNLKRLGQQAFRWSQKLPTWDAQTKKLEKLLTMLTTT